MGPQPPAKTPLDVRIWILTIQKLTGPPTYTPPKDASQMVNVEADAIARAGTISAAAVTPGVLRRDRLA